MGHGHAHFSAGSRAESGLESRREANRRRTIRKRAGWFLGLLLVPLGILSLIFMALLWPTGQHAEIPTGSPYATALGVSIDTGEVRSVEEGSCQGTAVSAEGQPEASPDAPQCLIAMTQPDAGGAQVPLLIPPDITRHPGVQPGDTVRYVNLANVTAGGQGANYVFMDFVRGAPMALLAAVYALVVVLVARWRGLRALIGLAAAYAVLAFFILPGLAEGKPGLLLGLVGAVVIMYGVLYFAHGVSARTSTALIGTLAGLAMTAGLTLWATEALHLTGAGDHNAYQLQSMSGQISLSGIITCGLIIAGLGVLNDVTITQSSAVWELYELAPETSAKELFGSAMRIGRDHIASTVYTIAFASAGASLPVLMLVMLYRLPLGDALTSAELAEEAARTLVGSIGLVLAIPVTTLVAVLVVKATGRRDGGQEVLA
ncbi:YibE/F family protein [Acaricomes phytoseiuli]|uniref:YibE/F family protein n=1 Tax=Acaricomes phytoseiuli TaxID=291968 RepID=UPI00039C04C2|nr:YibE/F family protein [Acaricomes phytoseiuli]MCW1250277.1 YibE/F family protein [Acaricomes phytoseiuli]